MSTQKQPIQPATRAKVLIVVTGDKFIEAFSSDQNIDLFFHHAPETPMCHKAEIVAEELIERSLPTFWSRVCRTGQTKSLRRSGQGIYGSSSLTIGNQSVRGSSSRLAAARSKAEILSSRS
ncbi:MAG: hypothetical protein ACKN85_01490 [Pirellula sp.]